MDKKNVLSLTLQHCYKRNYLGLAWYNLICTTDVVKCEKLRLLNNPESNKFLSMKEPLFHYIIYKGKKGPLLFVCLFYMKVELL